MQRADIANDGRVGCTTIDKTSTMLFDRISLLSYPSSSLGTALTLARLRTRDRRGPGKPAVSKNRGIVRTLRGPRRSIGREKRTPRRSYTGRSICSRSLKPITGTPFF